ncbi:unnamed protein product [Linum trigynum]|uniref:Gnk2-homologous domain-containing protein n=1 Tax=Linum trigynum TaxID=586398 RepID=A0AAV2G9J6_9ROSI
MSLPFLTLILLLQSTIIITSAAAKPLMHICSQTPNATFTRNSTYERNLRQLMGQLYYQTPPTGFTNATITGQQQSSPDQTTYGLANCRGDSTPSHCQACIVEAITTVHKTCPYSKEAIIWLDNCYLKYSSVRFFGRVDVRNKFHMVNVKNASGDIAPGFDGIRQRLMVNLAGEAAGDPARFYAAGQVEIPGSVRIYGLVQCGRDLSGRDCRRCADGLVGELPRFSDGKVGGRVVSGSCSVRFETYPFFRA